MPCAVPCVGTVCGASGVCAEHSVWREWGVCGDCVARVGGVRSAVRGASCSVRCLVWALCVARVGGVRSTVWRELLDGSLSYASA